MVARMDGHFSFRVDSARSLVRITMSGLFTRADVAAFVAARREAHAELRCAPNEHLTLNDLRGMKIQPQEIVAAFREVLADPRYRSRKLAFVTEPTLARAQLLRALGSRGVHCFDSVEAAEAWLLAEEAEMEPLRRTG